MVNNELELRVPYGKQSFKMLYSFYFIHSSLMSESQTWIILRDQVPNNREISTFHALR